MVVACYYDTHIFFWFIFKNRNPETEPLCSWYKDKIFTGTLLSDKSVKRDLDLKVTPENPLLKNKTLPLLSIYFLHFLSCLNEIGRHRQKNTKAVVSCEITILCPNCRHGVLLDDVNNLKNGVRLNYALSSIKETLTNFKSVPKVSNLACIPPGGWYIFFMHVRYNEIILHYDTNPLIKKSESLDFLEIIAYTCFKSIKEEL